MEGSLTSGGHAARKASARPQSARVQHLLAVAREQFVGGGFEAVSIDSIARASGVSKETIYRYYPDKEALFRAAAEELGGEFSATVERLHLSQASPGEELAGLSRAILDSAIDGGLLSAVWVSIGVARIMPEFARNLQSGQSDRLEPVCRLLEEIAAARGMEAAVPLDLASDFGSLSAESPALLMGFTSPGPAQRDVIAHRVAGL
ncbi:MAG: TetR/AcrR family transcriptional regulator, partial [Novosphingobium sp.]|nr:TetR/AcrR family transcriptional regulator [Novosphingobium sp.]